MSRVLFEVREENLDTGLRGYPVGTCSTSTVDPMKGLFYSGIPCENLIDRSPEEVIYLLLEGKLPASSELELFKKAIAEESHLSPETVEQVRKLPRKGHPMAIFPIALQILGIEEGKRDYQKDALSLIAKIGPLTAHVITHCQGRELSSPSKPELGTVQNFVSMIAKNEEDKRALLEPMRLFNILHFDHGGGNLSTFVGKAIASGLADMYGSMAGAMNALAGPRHGRANQDALEFLQKTVAEVGDKASLEEVLRYVEKECGEGRLIYGYGHAVLQVEDPRAKIFYDLSSKLYPQHPLIGIAHKLREVAPKVLSKNPKIRNPYPNVDAISGALLYAAGFDYPEFFTLLFGMSRTVGIAVQIVEERLVARAGKGTPLVRPKYIYTPRKK